MADDPPAVLLAHSARPELADRHRWQQGDLLMWDNCPTQRTQAERYSRRRIVRLGAALAQEGCTAVAGPAHTPRMTQTGSYDRTLTAGSSAAPSGRVLIVDDDAEIRTLLHDYLERNGYRCLAVPDGGAMLAALDQGGIDLIVLDVMLPGQDGLTLCRDLRARSDVPVIMLTARGEDTDRIIGLEMGADDYLSKPFNPRELLARVKVILRRSRGPARSDAANRARYLRFSDWRLDLTTRNLLSPAGVVVALSGAEFRLLKVFLDHPNRVLNRDLLMELTQGQGADALDRSIDVLVSRVRQRLDDDAREPRIIKTVRGEGYVLASAVSVE